MRFTFPPNRLGHGMLLLVGVAALSVVRSWPIMQWSYADTAAASAEFRQGVVLPGIFASAVAAWVAGSVSSPHLAFAPAGSARRGRELAYAHLIFLWTLGATGYAIGMTLMTLWTMSNRTYGQFDVSVAASGFACLTAYVACGYLAGCILPRYLGVPVSLAASYGVLFITPTILSPAFEFDIVSGQTVPLAVNLIRTMFFAAVATTASMASALWLRKRTTVDSKSSFSALAVLAAPIAATVYVSSQLSVPLVVADNADKVCAKSNSTDVCVHPARSTLLTPLTEGISRLDEASGGGIFDAPGVYDATLAEAEPSPSTMTLQIQGHDDRWLDHALIDIAWSTAGVDTCFELGEVGTPSDVSSAVAAWMLKSASFPYAQLLQTPGAEAQFEALDQKHPDNVHTLVKGNLKVIQECRSETLS